MNRPDPPQPQADALPPRLFGYDVLARLGEGAASVIYAVSDRKTSQVYALKHVIRHTEKDDRFIAQLENEYQVASQFRHPALRKCVDLKINRTLLRKVIDAALLMELVDGVPLDQNLPKDPRRLVDGLVQAGKALGALHYLRYVHCDFKPHNILVSADNSIKLVDFGQAARIGTAKPRIQGTPDFIAPEQVKCKPVSERTDIYSFGASLYWALTGRRVPTLFTVEKSERRMLVEQHFPTPRELNDKVPEALSKLVMHCLEIQPAARPRDMAGVLDRLERAAAGL